MQMRRSSVESIESIQRGGGTTAILPETFVVVASADGATTTTTTTTTRCIGCHVHLPKDHSIDDVTANGKLDKVSFDALSSHLLRN